MDTCNVCGGKIKPKRIIYIKEHNGQVIAIDNVPAEVCERCGEEYFSPKVADKIRRIIQSKNWIKTLSIPYAEMRA